MTIQTNDRIKSAAGHDILIGAPGPIGGEGMIYYAVDRTTGQKVVVKIFFPGYSLNDRRTRTRFLLAQNLQTANIVLAPPTDIIDTASVFGHIMPYVGVQALEELLAESPGFSFQQGLCLAFAIAQAIATLEALGIAHGDIHAENIRVTKSGNGLIRCFIIDIDNFRAPGQPLPGAIGQIMYIAPELRRAMAQKKIALPTIESDRFALGVVFMEILLRKHLAFGRDQSPEDFDEVMTEGSWTADITRMPPKLQWELGYSAAILNPEISRLFRAAFSLDPRARPDAATWARTLLAALQDSVFVCPRCGGQVLIDSGKQICPYQGCKAYPHLAIELPGKKAIELKAGAIPVGRADFGAGAAKVSKRHAIFRRRGPETLVEPLGTNGVFRWTGKGWGRLPDKKALLVQEGDRLKFADIEVKLIERL